MLNDAKTLKGYKLNGLDGEIGKIKEFGNVKGIV